MAINSSGGVVTGALKNVRSYTGAGTYTYTVPSDVRYVKVFVTGGGGGGQGHEFNDSGASGGGGGTAIEFLDLNGVSSVTVTVGGGGTA